MLPAEVRRWRAIDRLKKCDLSGDDEKTSPVGVEPCRLK
jgi:hypothetical protein